MTGDVVPFVADPDERALAALLHRSTTTRRAPAARGRYQPVRSTSLLDGVKRCDGCGTWVVDVDRCESCR